ncbi:MAG: thioredoxin family protein, partial [Deltaproteobacteria bacterium]|nr:thioredoxin family protein [Deltaproteobacteria bacterium]
APAGSTAAPRTRPPAKIDWLRSEEQARARAARDRRMLLIDFAAEWCAPCQEMDEKTFRDPDLASLLAQRYLALKIDVTEMTKEQEALLARYRVKQLPVILVLGPDGKELYRWTDFVAAGPMRDKLEQLRP